jgi:hypothetical protein
MATASGTSTFQRMAARYESGWPGANGWIAGQKDDRFQVAWITTQKSTERNRW